jgi:GTP-binding protein
MKEGKFIDYAKIHVESGRGGGGSAHLRREKFVEKGGPDGGDGGRGGHIVIRGNENLWTLYEFNFRRHFRGGHGGDGSKQRSTGAQGNDQIIDVPVGTVVRNTDSDKVIEEITENGQELVILEGGRGGRGNTHFKSSTRQTPRFSQPGEAGEEKDITLELKVLADVGLVGFPNAGKSTLLSVITAAKPKIADYEFTTLKPNLGIVEYRDYQSFVVADIPGIIEGAAEGKGLGFRFLRHIERNSTLLFVIPCDADDIRKQYDILLDELARYSPELMDKERFLVISKCDMLDDELKQELDDELKKDFKQIPYRFISAVSSLGLTELKDELWEILNRKPKGLEE